MKTKFFLYTFFTLILINCKGQTNDKISINFSTLSEYYFDRDEKIPSKFNSDIKNGEYTIYFIPKHTLKNYYDTFLKSNNIHPIEDEYNDTYSYKKEDNKKISVLLKKKLADTINYKIVGKYIASKYFTDEGGGNYSLSFPYVIKFYKKNKNKWIFIKEFNVKNYDDDIKYSKKEFIESLILKTDLSTNKISNVQETSEKKWYGKYTFTLNEDSEDWRDMHDFELTISKEGITYLAKGFQLYEFYKLSFKNKNNSLQLFFSEALDNTENLVRLEKTKDFGILNFDGKKYTWSCPYIDESFTTGKKNAYILKKGTRK